MPKSDYYNHVEAYKVQLLTDIDKWMSALVEVKLTIFCSVYTQAKNRPGSIIYVF